MKWLVYNRESTMGMANAGHAMAAIITWFAIDSGLAKLGVIPGGAGYAPTGLVSREVIAVPLTRQRSRPVHQPAAQSATCPSKEREKNHNSSMKKERNA